jgi:hypothetical protein
VTRQEAEQRARLLAGEHPERHYVARETVLARNAGYRDCRAGSGRRG